MSNTNDYILLKRADVAKAIKDWSMANYAMQLLAYICETRDLDLSVRADEVCKLFSVNPRHLEDIARKRRIKSVMIGNIRIYEAFEVARTIEEMHRIKRFRALNKIPSSELK